MGDKKRDFMKMHEGKIGKQYNFDDSDEDPVYYPEQPVRTQRVVEPDGDKVRDFMRMHEGKIGKQYNFDDADEDPVYYPEQPVRTQRVVEPDVNGFYYVQKPASESRVEETSTRSVSILPRTWQNMPEDQMRTLAKRFNLDAKCVNKQELIDKLSAFAKKDTTQKCGRSILDKRQFNDPKKKAYTMAQHLDCWDGNDFNFPDHLQLQEKPLYIGRRQVPDWMVQDLKRVQSEKGSQVHKRPEPEPVLTTDGPANAGGATSSKKPKPSVDAETQKRIDSMKKPILMGIGVGYGMQPSGLNKPDLVRLIVDSCSNEHTKRNANCHVGPDRNMTRKDPKLALYTLSEYIGCWDPASQKFNFGKQNPEPTPEPSVETRAEPECHVPKSVEVQQQGGSKLMGVPRSVRNKHVLNMSDPGSSTSLHVTDKANTRPQFVSDSEPEACSGDDAEEETTSSSNSNAGQGTLSPSNGSVEQYEHKCICGCAACKCYLFSESGNFLYL